MILFLLDRFVFTFISPCSRKPFTREPSSRTGEDMLRRVSSHQLFAREKQSAFINYTNLEAFYTIWILSSFHSDFTLAPLYGHRSLKMGDSLGKHLDPPEMYSMSDVDCHSLLQLSFSLQRPASLGKIIKESQYHGMV